MAKPKHKKHRGRKAPPGMSQREFSAMVHGGTAYYDLKHSTSRQQFKRLVREARRRGTTLEGLASGLPAAMQPLTRQGLAKQARKTVRSAYAPSFADLSQQEQRVNAISEKRRTDNEAYSRWLNDRQNEMALKGKAADDMLLAHQAQMQKDLQTTFDQMQAGAHARQAATAGNVSAPGESVALDFSDERAHEAERLAAQRQQSQDSIKSGQGRSDQLATAVQLFMAAQEGKRQSDQSSALKDIGDERGRLRLSRAGDIQKEIARLLDTEIGKAQSNREFSAAAQKLGLDAAELKFEIKDKLHDNALADRSLSHKMSQDQIKNRLEEISLQLESGRLSETERHNLASERLRLLDIKTGGKKGAKGKDTTAWRQYRGLVGQARMYTKGKASRARKARTAMQLDNKSADPLLIQAAVQIATRGYADPEIARQVNRMYGFRVKTSGGGYTGNSIPPRNSDGTPG